MEEGNRAPGIWIPYAVLSIVASFVVFVVTFIGTVRVMDKRIETEEAHTIRIENKLDDALEERRKIEDRLTRLETKGDGK